MKKINRKTGETLDKIIIKHEMNFIDSFQSYCQNFSKTSRKKRDEFRYKYKNCKYAHIKKYEKQEMNIIPKKYVHNYDCVTIVMTYVKNINLTIGIANVF